MADVMMGSPVSIQMSEVTTSTQGAAAPWPDYRGLEHVGGRLPHGTQQWPKFWKQNTAMACGDTYDIARQKVYQYASERAWVWPSRMIYFLCDQHADADAFFRSLVASGGVEKTGPGDGDFRLTEAGKEGTFIIGGDCLDKGPSNLRFLRALKSLIDTGADVELLAGNHDVRALVGLAYIGRKEPHLAHLFVRMGRKSLNLLHEIHEGYVRDSEELTGPEDDEHLHQMLFPDDSWFDQFPKAVEGILSPAKIDKEVVRIREKIAEFSEECASRNMTLRDVFAATVKASELFTDPNGEFTWFYDRMTLARREGSFLFVHAGVDDEVAREIVRFGVEKLNETFRSLMAEDLFGLYHGPIGNMFRTKYRRSEPPLTDTGTANMHRAGIHAIVHGHRNIPRGQRMVMRRGLLNFECDASVDCNTRDLLGLDGLGGAVTIFEPDGTVTGISTDYPHAKQLDAANLFGMTLVGGERRSPARAGADSMRGGKTEMSDKQEVKFESSMAVEETVAYLEAIVAGIKKGAVSLKQADQSVTLKPVGDVDVEVKAVHKKKKEEITIELSWRVPVENDLMISNVE
jgi:amphi-Trp domain-containing protein